jgi:hypothetical protein
MYLAFPYFLVGGGLYVHSSDTTGVCSSTRKESCGNGIWGRVLRDVTPWSSIVGISMTPAKGKVLAFFRKGTTGWRVKFSSEDRLRAFLKDVAPGVPME